MKKTSLKIKGMHCATCAMNIESALKEAKGISSAQVNFSMEKAAIEYDPKKIKESEIKRIVKETGYEVLEKEGEAEEEIKKEWRRFWFGLLLTVPVFLIATFYYNPQLNFLLFALATPVQIVLGWPFYRGAYFSLKQKTAGMDVLVSLSSLSAYIYSLAATFFIKGPVFYEASATVLTTITLGKLLEQISRGKVGEAIKKLMALTPKREVKKGEIVAVKPGEAIPADGIIIEGRTTIDESMITGESIPVDKKIGDEVIGATINKTGYFKFKATKVGTETTLAQIIKLVEEAQTKKAPIQRIADQVVSWFVPVVIVIAVFSFFVWYFFQGATFLFALTALVSVLVISCPCALGIATPTAIMAGTSKGAENGILIKGGEHLEKAQQLTTLVFDKTGTLTKGEPEVIDVIGDVLPLAASLAAMSNHPLDKAIINEAKRKKIKLLPINDFQSFSGKGLKGKIKGKEIRLGNRRWIKSNLGLELEKEGKTVMLIAEDSKVKGAVAVADALKEYSKEAIESLKRMGLEIWMISGDNEKTAQAVGKKLGIKKILAEVLPQDKEKKIKKLQKKGKVVGAVGDGINDAPMLAQADIGIAMGAGTDIAKETGGIILVKDDIRDVVRAIKLSKKTMQKIKQNIFLAFIYNVLAIPIAAGVFYHWTGFMLRPEIAALAMILSDISVVGNAWLLRRYKFTSSQF